MQVQGAILAIKVQVTGVSQVQASLNSVRRSIAATTTTVQDATAAAKTYGLAMLSAGLGVAREAIKGYEAMESVRRSFVAFLGATEGNALAAWLRDFSRSAVTASSTLSAVAQDWISSTGDASRVRPLIEAIERFGSSAGKSREQVERVGKAIADIQNKGTFQAEEKRQLANAGVQLPKVAKILGFDNITQAYGQDGKKVVDAILKAFNELPPQTPLLLGRIAKEAEHLALALAPTGALMEALFTPVVMFGGFIISVFEKVNGFFLGIPGFVLSVAFLVKGVRLLSIALKDASIWQGILNALQTPYATFARVLMGIQDAYKKIVTVLKTEVTLELIGAILKERWATVAAAGAVAAAAGVAWYNGAYGGGNDSAPSTAPAPSRGGAKRSSFDNFMYGQFGRLAGA